MMMTFHGNTALMLQDKSQTRNVTILLDPYTEGKEVPASKDPTIVLYTKGQGTYEFPPETFIIEYAGEYEVQGVMVYGTQIGEDTVYRIEIDDWRMIYLGHLHSPLTDAHVESFGDVDLLCVPVGGHDVLTAEQAEKVIQKIQPRLVVPLAYDGQRDLLQNFLKLLGKKDIEPVDRYKIIKKQLPEDDMAVVVLTP